MQNYATWIQIVLSFTLKLKTDDVEKRFDTSYYEVNLKAIAYRKE